MRPWVVWGAGLFAYIVAVLDRTSLGVSGLQAADRFDAGPTLLASFVVLQLAVYAAAQIPGGILLDRYGSRALIAVGAALLTAGQLTLAITESLPVAIAARAVVGLGDAATFISVLRLIPAWFPDHRAPLVIQLTGFSGQLGQVLSAIPFLALVVGPGWSTAYASSAAVGAIAVVLALALIRDTPPGVTRAPTRLTARTAVRSVRTAWRRPGTRQGLFTHMGTQLSITVFALMWGVPYVTVAHGLSTAAAGGLLTVAVLTTICAGTAMGILTGRAPHLRAPLALVIIGANAVMWTVVLALPAPAPAWLLVLLVIVIAVGGPASVIGFDLARTDNDYRTLGTAAGIVNGGGFLASLLAMLAVGAIVDAAGGYSFDAFRLAWTVQYLVWAVAVAGIVINRSPGRRAGPG